MCAHKKNISFILAVLALLVSAMGAQSEELTFSASVDRTRVGLDDYLTLTVSVSGKDIGGISQPDLPSLDGFEIVGTNSSSSSQFTLVNGKMTSSKTIDYIYTLRPREVGKITIGAATLKLKGKTYKTEPIEIEVVAGSASSQGKTQPSPRTSSPSPPSPTENLQSEDLFLRADFDQKKVYPGQQVTVTYTLYNRTQLANVQYEQVPSFTGFWAEEIYNADRLNFQQQVIGGKQYQVAVLKKLALFPTTCGKIQVDPMELVCDLRLRSRDFFDFFGRTKRVRISNKPVTITVQPLPDEGKPQGFAGTVGRFSITASVDQRQVRAGEALQLVVKIRGQGNLKTLPAPQLPPLDNFKSFEPEIQEQMSTTGDKIGGTKTYRYVLIPKQQGQFLIETVQFSYFDPARKAYQTARTEPIAIEVLPGEKGEFPLILGLGREEIKLLGRDIRYIKPSTAAIKDEGGDLYSNRAFQILQIAPLLAIFAAILTRRRRDRIRTDVGYARWRGAYRQSRQGLRAAHRLMRSESSARFYSAMAKTLSNYLGDKLNISVGGITSQHLRDELVGRQMEEQLVQQILDCLHACDYSRFAPASSQLADMETMLKRVRDLISRLEKTGLGTRRRNSSR
ncbi:protein BatD [bacterium]|nr:protein BatD [bacterium]